MKETNPMIKMLAPLAKKYINSNNVAKVYDSIVERFSPDEGDRIVLMVSKPDGANVKGSVVSLNNENKIMAVFAQEEMAELLNKLLESL